MTAIPLGCLTLKAELPVSAMTWVVLDSRLYFIREVEEMMSSELRLEVEM